MSFLQSKSGQGEAHVQFPSYNVSSACMSLCANTACSTYVMLAFVLHGNMDSSRQLTACSRPIADATWWHHTHACTSRLLAQTCRHLCKWDESLEGGPSAQQVSAFISRVALAHTHRRKQFSILKARYRRIQRVVVVEFKGGLSRTMSSNRVNVVNCNCIVNKLCMGKKGILCTSRIIR